MGDMPWGAWWFGSFLYATYRLGGWDGMAERLAVALFAVGTCAMFTWLCRALRRRRAGDGTP